MRGMTKSAVRVAREALAIGRRSFPAYDCRTSRHDFTQAQLFALLVLRQFLRTDYRGLVTLVVGGRSCKRPWGCGRCRTIPPWPMRHAVSCLRPKMGAFHHA
jgi:hypothetical protein